VNEKTCIDTEAVRDAIEKHKVVMLKADMTKEDQAIVAGLDEFGRSSVPLYLTYRPLPASKTAPSTAPAGK
jgi:thiol:disulfide interchange protein